MCPWLREGKEEEGEERGNTIYKGKQGGLRRVFGGRTKGKKGRRGRGRRKRT